MTNTENVIRNFDAAVRAYLTESASIGLAEETIRNYGKRIKRFRTFWTETEPTENPTAEDIRNYRDHLQETVAKKTAKQYLVELKAFFEFACDSDFAFFEKNPVSRKMYPKLTDEDDTMYKKILTADDLKALWKNQRPKGFARTTWARNYAIVTLLLDGKIRNKELLDLRLSDIDFEYGEIEIRKGKGDKHRWITVSDISLTAIKLYLEAGVRPENLSDDDYLFGTAASHEFGNGMRKKADWHKGTRQWLSELVEKHIARVTGKHGFRSHSLRHNGSIIDLNTGKSLERIQSELGHSSITTTEIYAGRLQSVRKTRDYKSVVETRDKCAAENAERLQRLA